jgi:hypothetical protein
MRHVGVMLSALCAVAAVATAAPIVELSLSTAPNAHASLASSVASVEAKRDAIFDAGLRKLTLAYGAAKVAGAKQLSESIGAATHGKYSFAAFNPVEPTVKAHLVRAKTDDSAGIAEFTNLEISRDGALNSIISQATSEFSEITKVIVGEFSRQVAQRTKKQSFLQGSGFNKELNVRLFANPSYGTIGALAEQAEKRRDVQEDYLRRHILDLELKLVEYLIATGEKAVRGL